MTRQLQAAGIEVLRPAAFAPGNFQTTTLDEVKRSGTRIIVFMAFDQDTKAVASHANHMGMTSPGWSWLVLEERIAIPQIQGWLYFRPFLPAEGMQSFAAQVAKYTNSHFDFNGGGLCQDRNNTSKYGTTCAESLAYCKKRGINWRSPGQTNEQACPATCGACAASAKGPISADSVDLTFSAALFNAVLLYAHAATKVLSMGGDLYDDIAVTEAVRSTTFEGAGSSVVALDNHGDRIGSYEVMNYVVGPHDVMSSVPIGVYNSTRAEYTAKGLVVWPVLFAFELWRI